jgi:hypothetical protein
MSWQFYCLCTTSAFKKLPKSAAAVTVVVSVVLRTFAQGGDLQLTAGILLDVAQ